MEDSSVLKFIFSLDEVEHNPRVMIGSTVDVLCAVRNVAPVKKFPSKTAGGSETKLREVKIFDETANSVILKLWNSEWIDMAEKWNPMKDILHLADVRVDKDKFR